MRCRALRSCSVRRAASELHGVDQRVVVGTVGVEDVSSRQVHVLVVDDHRRSQHKPLLRQKSPRQSVDGGEQRQIVGLRARGCQALQREPHGAKCKIIVSLPGAGSTPQPALSLDGLPW